MLKSYKYQLNLNNEQKEFMNKSFGCARFVYNYALNRKIESYNSGVKVPSQFDLNAEITQLKKQEDFKWLNDVDRQNLNVEMANLNSAYQGFFKLKRGFPKYKSRHSKQSCTFTQSIKVNFDNNKINLPKIGWCNAFISRGFNGIIKKATVSRNASGKYFVSILVEDHREVPIKKPIKEETTIGIDVGIKSFLVTSNGDVIDNPKFYEKELRKLAYLQRQLSRKKKGSNNRAKAKHKVAKHHYKISCKRNDFLHKLTSKIISENQTVIIEDLDIQGMMKNKYLAKSIGSVSWGEFFRQIEYKALWYGVNLIKIGRYEPSSKLCSCGVKNNELKLKDREWTCNSCHTTHDRDLLAAQNIKQIGLLKYSGQGMSSELVEVSQ